jgi:hypothetical protein
VAECRAAEIRLAVDRQRSVACCTECRTLPRMPTGREAIELNIRLVIDQLGPMSGIDFGLNRESLEWVEGYIEQQRQRPDVDEAGAYTLRQIFGSFLGECILVATGGSWEWSAEFGKWCVRLPGNDNVAYPFAKMEKLWLSGVEGGDSIVAFYDGALLIAQGRLADHLGHGNRG